MKTPKEWFAHFDEWFKRPENKVKTDDEIWEETVKQIQADVMAGVVKKLPYITITSPDYGPMRLCDHWAFHEIHDAIK